MSKELERAQDEIRDALAFGGDVPGMRALVPVINALNDILSALKDGVSVFGVSLRSAPSWSGCVYSTSPAEELEGSVQAD